MKIQNNTLKKDAQQKPPKYLYKYFPINEYTESIFVKNEVFFTSPLQFNDPFDSRLNRVFKGSQIAKKLFIRKELKQLPSCSNEQRREILNNPMKIIEFEENLQKLGDDFRNQMGVFCLSAKKDNILMWSHYAQQHQGFCLEFDPKYGFFQRSHPIIYDTKLPTFNILKYKGTKDEKLALANSLLTKSEDWEYEQEWRVINLPEHGGPGVHKLHKESLTGIIFGFRINEEDRKQIILWCETRKHKPNYYITRPKKENYGLEIVPFEKVK